MAPSPDNLLIVITAYNEEDNLPHVLGPCAEHEYPVLVVDDGSLDETRSVARSYGARVVSHPMNLGQGHALLTGFRVAVREGAGTIVEMDADGQHDPSEIPAFLECMERTGADIVVGSRIMGSNHPDAPFFRRTFLPHVTSAINMLSGYRMSDAMCGFRVFRGSSLARVEPALDAILEPQYVAAEMFLRFAAKGMSVAEVPVHLKDRSSGKSSKGFVRYGYGVARATIRALADLKIKRNP